MTRTTATLWNTLRATPREGFAALHSRVAPELTLWAGLHLLPTLRTWLPVEDFLQDVWARAYAHFPAFDTARGEFRAWLFGIAYNVLREHLRSHRVRTRWQAQVFEEGLARDPATSILTRMHADDMHRAVTAAVAELDATDRRIVTWHGLEGLSHAIVAQRLGVSIPTVERHWRRALDRLRARLSADQLVRILPSSAE